jgi:hypothetical protein
MDRVNGNQEHNNLNRATSQFLVVMIKRTRLFAVITTLSLRKKRGLASFVLRNLVRSVLTAVLALAVRVACFGNVHLGR